MAKLDQETFCILFSDETIALVLFFLFKLEIETNLSNFEEKIIFEGFFDSRLKMKLPTQKKISNGKGRPKIYSEDKIEASSFFESSRFEFEGLSTLAQFFWFVF